MKGEKMILFGVIAMSVAIVLWIWGIASAYNSSRNSLSGKQAGLLGGALVTTLVSGWVLAPWFHWFWFGLLYRHLYLWIVTAVLVLVSVLLSRALKVEIVRNWVLGIGISFAVIWLFTYMLLSGAWQQSIIVEDTTYQEISVLPETTALRFLPLDVAENYASSRLDESTLQFGDPDPIVRDDGVDWVLPLIPDGFWNKVSKKSDGIAVVNPDGSIRFVRQKMECGEGMIGADNIMWQLRKEHYGSEYPEFFYIEHEGEVLLVAPRVDYKLRFPVTVPMFAGVYLVDGDCNMQFLNPEEAATHPVLEGIRIVPESLAKLWVEAHNYQHGIANKIFTHEDEMEIPSVGGISGNEMPFLLPTADGPKWFISVTPWGIAEGIFRIYLIDAITGEIEVFSVPDGQNNPIGPNRARQFIVGEFPRVDWDKFALLEPRPVVRDGELFWLFTQTPTSFAGVTDTILVNAATTEVRSLGRSEATVLAFLRGADVGTVIDGDTPPSSGGEIPNFTDGMTQEEVKRLIADLRRLAEQLERDLETDGK